MRKLIKSILTIGLAATLCAGATACSLFNNDVTAYELAVKNGFVGTEEEWLRSLHGADGENGKDLTAQDLYAEAVENGFGGTFVDFCKTLGITLSEKNDTAKISENMLSVVSIYCGYSVTTGGNWLFGEEESYGTQAGSGVIVDLNKTAGNATIITNYHVLYNLESDQKGILDEIWVYPYGAFNAFTPDEGDKYGDGIKARYVGGSMDYDIAVIQIEGSEYIKNSNVQKATFADSDEVTVGEETYAIGNPEGAGISVTNGILSVDSEYIVMEALDERDTDRDGEVDGVSYRVMRTTAAINGGNSGGGLFNTKGELIGIVNAKSAGSETDNMGYALPSSQVKAVYENILRNGGEVRQATLGIIVSLTSSKAVFDENGNARIIEEFSVSTAAERGSAAYRKLNAGDVFLYALVNGSRYVPFTRKHQLTDLLLSIKMNDEVTFAVRDANGDEVTTTIRFDQNKYFKLYI